MSEDDAGALVAQHAAGKLAIKKTAMDELKSAMALGADEAYSVGANQGLADEVYSEVNLLTPRQIRQIGRTRDIMENDFHLWQNGIYNPGRIGERIVRKMGYDLYTPRPPMMMNTLERELLTDPIAQSVKKGVGFSLDDETGLLVKNADEIIPGEPGTHKYNVSATENPVGSPYNAPEYKGYGGIKTPAGRAGNALGWTIGAGGPVALGAIFAGNAAREQKKNELLKQNEQKDTEEMNKSLKQSQVNFETDSSGKTVHYMPRIVADKKGKNGEIIKGNAQDFFNMETNPRAGALYSSIYDKNGAVIPEELKRLELFTERALKKQAAGDDSDVRALYEHMENLYRSKNPKKANIPGNIKSHVIAGIYNGGLTNPKVPSMTGNRLVLFADPDKKIYKLLNVKYKGGLDAEPEQK